ncbi:AKR_collapsed_G0020450.mRNA.1.CDS.1 [Saccharomyces cerevisiae]|nr:AKR_collapsed_G0020450.mRNA.1.CDS.1 [Saccharomyces cerevisiae]
MEGTIRPLNYADIETSGPINLLETTNNLKSSLKKFSQKAKGSHISKRKDSPF